MLIKVKTFPFSKEEKIIKEKEDAFSVFIKEKPERGLASKRLIIVLGKYFDVKTSKIRIIKGLKQRNKIVEIKE